MLIPHICHFSPETKFGTQFFSTSNLQIFHQHVHFFHQIVYFSIKIYNVSVQSEISPHHWFFSTDIKRTCVWSLLPFCTENCTENCSTVGTVGASSLCQACQACKVFWVALPRLVSFHLPWTHHLLPQRSLVIEKILKLCEGKKEFNWFTGDSSKSTTCNMSHGVKKTR